MQEPIDIKYRQIRSQIVIELHQDSVLALRSISVVVTAESHNPSILSPDFLVSKGIVPDDWQANEILTTSHLSMIKHSNGVNWLIEPSRLVVAEDAGPEFRSSYNIYKIVKTYLNVLQHVPYRDLGINFQVAVAETQPQLRLMQRFGAGWMKDREWIIGMIPSFKIKTKDAICLIRIPDVTPGNGEIRLDCNIHHKNLLSSVDLCDAITKWPDRQEFVRSTITKLFNK